MFIIRTKFFIKLAMMKTYDQSVEIFHNPNWPYISDHRYRISIIGGSGSGKGDVLLNLTKHQGLVLTEFIYTSEIHSNQSNNCVY